MDPVAVSGAVGALDKIGARDGFIAVMCIVLIAAIALIVRAFLGFLRDERTDAREERKAHIEALGSLKGSIEQQGATLGVVGEGVRDIKAELIGRRRAGGE